MTLSSTTASTASTNPDATALSAAWAPATDAAPALLDSQASQSLAVTRGSTQTAADRSTRNSATQASAADQVAASPDSTSSTGISSDATLSGQSSDWVEQFQSWSVLGEAQSTVADTQASEAGLQRVYRQLQQLNRQLDQDSSQADQLADQLQQLDQSLQQSGSLTADLQSTALSENGATQQFTLSKVDLLSARPSDEQLRIYFPASRSGVTVNLAAGSSGQQVADTLDSALQKEGVSVSLNDAGQLTFSAGSSDVRKLSQPVLMSGQGIRVPAGNAVSVRLQAEQSTLGELATSVGSASTRQQKQAVQQQIQSLQQQILQTVQQLRGYRQQVVQDSTQLAVQTLSGSSDSSALQQSRQAVQQALGNQDYAAVSTTLQAQANLSSQTVVALLSPLS